MQNLPHNLAESLFITRLPDAHRPDGVALTCNRFEATLVKVLQQRDVFLSICSEAQLQHCCCFGRRCVSNRFWNASTRASPGLLLVHNWCCWFTTGYPNICIILTFDMYRSSMVICLVHSLLVQ
jgi:hypothetical protein